MLKVVLDLSSAANGALIMYGHLPPLEFFSVLSVSHRSQLTTLSWLNS